MDVIELRICPECTLDMTEAVYFLDDNHVCTNCGRDYSRLVAGYNYNDTEIRKRGKNSHRRIKNTKRKHS